MENFRDQIVYEKIPWLWKIYLIKYCLENFLDNGKFSWSNFLWKIFLALEKFLGQRFCGKLSWSIFLWKLSLIKLFVENYLNCVKFIWSRKITLTVEILFGQIKLLWLWKTFLIKENYLNCGRLIFLTAKNKSPVFNIEQKLLTMKLLNNLFLI